MTEPKPGVWRKGRGTVPRCQELHPTTGMQCVDPHEPAHDGHRAKVKTYAPGRYDRWFTTRVEPLEVDPEQSGEGWA